MKKKTYWVRANTEGEIVVKIKANSPHHATLKAILGIEGDGQIELLTYLRVTKVLEVNEHELVPKKTEGG